MTFTSLTFICFLPLVFALYWIVAKPQRQNIVLVLASYLFYGWWDYRFCALILFSSLLDFAIGWYLGKAKTRQRRKILLTLSVVANLGLLGVFKYFNFFAESFASLAGGLGWVPGDVTLNIVLPVGISFYTFQTLSYSIDIYRGKIRATGNLINYLAFVSFFPQLVAGPIERASNLLPQFAKSRAFDQQLARSGCRLILWGFFKKVVIADRLAVIVDQVYGQPEASSGPLLAFATFCFAFQIYCDFSAYSDIAIGTARLFGIRLMRNFAYPYFSQSVSEFWRRWHISLSTWFRDYVYIPLGGSRTTGFRRSRNLLTTFVVSGLWHGAGWQFLAWGGIHGGAVAASHGGGGHPSGTSKDSQPVRQAKRSDSPVPGGDKNLPRLRTILKIMTTFGIVCLCWVFFRASSIGDAMLIIGRIGSDWISISAWQELGAYASEGKIVKRSVFLLTGFVLFEWIQRRKMCPLDIGGPAVIRWATYTLVFWGTLYYMIPSAGQQFIYFEF